MLPDGYKVDIHGPSGLVYSWSGGHTVNVYTSDGEIQDCFEVFPSDGDVPSFYRILSSVKDHEKVVACTCEPHAEPPTSGWNPKCPTHGEKSGVECPACEGHGLIYVDGSGCNDVSCRHCGELGRLPTRMDAWHVEALIEDEDRHWAAVEDEMARG